MTTKTIAVCDFCKDRISDMKCDICGRDICYNCSNDEENRAGVLYLEDSFGNQKNLFGECDHTGEVHLCEKCYDKELLNPNGKFMKDVIAECNIQQVIKEKLEKHFALEQLEK